ncbi:hypothetical protein [Aeromonas enteropelogenes]|uniref:hypothetical protein n=1 Tax=Aeromonas enteropelogenes TaxID=29489 RepID=UPI003BA3B97D
MDVVLLLLSIAYWYELFDLPRYLRQLQYEYDSLTRLIYSGGQTQRHRRFPPQDVASPQPNRAGTSQ